MPRTRGSATQTELGAEIQALESSHTTDFGPNIDTLVGNGTDVVFTVGFPMADITKAKALASPGTVFAGVDEYFDAPRDNLLGMSFKEHEAAYLAGVVAGLGTLDTGLDARINAQNKIAFIGGMDIPPVERFEAGFVAGAKSVNAGVEVLISYAGAFDDEAQGEGWRSTRSHRRRHRVRGRRRHRSRRDHGMPGRRSALHWRGLGPVPHVAWLG